MAAALLGSQPCDDWGLRHSQNYNRLFPLSLMTQKFLIIVVSCCFSTLRLFYKCFASELLVPLVKDKGKNILANCKDKIRLIMYNQFIDSRSYAWLGHTHCICLNFNLYSAYFRVKTKRQLSNFMKSESQTDHLYIFKYVKND